MIPLSLINCRFAAVVLCLQIFVSATLAQDNGSGKKSQPPVLKNDVCAEAVSKQSQSKPPDKKVLPAPTTPVPTQEENIKVETTLVRVPVSVTDRAGREALGLGMQHFDIYENGLLQDIAYFEPVDMPFTVILVIDVSPSTKLRFDDIKNEAISFVSMLRPDDRVGVILFDRSVRVLTEPTADRNQMLKAIFQVSVEGGTSIYDAVDLTMKRELPPIQGRKAVVLLTDGVDTTSSRASYESTLRDVAESDALFYTIRYDTSQDQNFDVSGYNPSNTKVVKGAKGTSEDVRNVVIGTPSDMNLAEYQKGRRYLELLAEMTGGREFEAGSIYHAGPSLSGVADELRRQYTLGYYPNPLGQLGERKQIKVKLKVPDSVAREALVRAKPCYIVAAPTKTTH